MRNHNDQPMCASCRLLVVLEERDFIPWCTHACANVFVCVLVSVCVCVCVYLCVFMCACVSRVRGCVSVCAGAAARLPGPKRHNCATITTVHTSLRIPQCTNAIDIFVCRRCWHTAATNYHHRPQHASGTTCLTNASAPRRVDAR